MLVDLGRNDLSRVCVPGTVHVERFLEPERFSHVTHLVSEVAGELQDGLSSLDLLRAARSSCTRAWPFCKPAPGSLPTRTRPPSTRSVCENSLHWSWRSSWPRLGNDLADR